MKEKFIDIEKQWLELLMSVDFPGKEVIERQLADAQVTNRVVESTYADAFLTTTCPEPHPYKLHRISMTVIPTIGTPIIFTLHVNRDGFIDYLAIDSLSGEDIDYYDISFEDVRHDVEISLDNGIPRLRND